EDYLLATIEGVAGDESDRTIDGRIAFYQIEELSSPATALLVDSGTAPKANQRPAMACAITGACLVVWSEGTSDFDLVGAIVRSNGVVSGPFFIANESGDELSPAVASDGAMFVVAWERDGTLWTRHVQDAA